ncbi:hypothetical protein [Pyrococcus kukulkanii]|uniref:hypothetical protein n=1 Tax=Pyrococcus kukulkanii TaxID=1609559 RepID=UPI000AB8D92C|nr:hypothetical protein [Pyrococcus kukulkanii]
MAGLLGLIAKLAGRGEELLERLDRFDEELVSNPKKALWKVATYPVDTSIKFRPSGRYRRIRDL